MKIPSEISRKKSQIVRERLTGLLLKAMLLVRRVLQFPSDPDVSLEERGRLPDFCKCWPSLTHSVAAPTLYPTWPLKRPKPPSDIQLAERIADRLEVERSAAREMQIARDVQSRLFPQVAPPPATLEYAGRCIQARQVGGDYYDFLDLGSSHVAFVLADISGKGIAGALLMANLQANLRSRYAVALDDLPRLLKSVNQLFFESSPDDRYATLFFAAYDDSQRELTYANCGHNPPLVFRTNGSIERLTATASVIGLFLSWKCETRECTLTPGDVLVIYTDGVTEAVDAAGDEFGEARLTETVRSNIKATPTELLVCIQDAVQKFSAGEQSDDLTVLIARVR